MIRFLTKKLPENLGIDLTLSELAYLLKLQNSPHKTSMTSTLGSLLSQEPEASADPTIPSKGRNTLNTHGPFNKSMENRLIDIGPFLEKS